jgi:hypothetical protein
MVSLTDGGPILEASTYYFTFNLLGLARPLLIRLPFTSKAGSAIVGLERPRLRWLRRGAAVAADVALAALP